jgi:pyrimidine-nucleoside phosphorylase
MTTAALIQDSIRKKRDGLALSKDEIRDFVRGVTDLSIPDYQVAAMLMAMFLRGLDDDELGALTDAMVHSGEVIEIAATAHRPLVDKHSTGGVGDKISLPLAPAVAACGVAVPMVSGRGLGHTGGTLDKLESIPGFCINLDTAAFTAQVARLGVAMIGQTEKLAPADRRLYALRDVTGTVESVPLIAASIMSKKLAEGIDALVIDCKVGHGAFMKTMDQARALARALLTTGKAAGKQVSVLITDMNAPIGTRVGNALEVVESIEILRGQGPEDTRELTLRLGGEMLRLTGVAATEDEGVAQVAAALGDGSALELFGRMIEAQGGDRRVIDEPARLPRAPGTHAIRAERDGLVKAIASADIGRAALALGAGRARKEDAVDPGVGIELCARVGDRVQAGQDLALLIHNDRGVDRAAELCRGAFTIADQAQAPARTRILETLR